MTLLEYRLWIIIITILALIPFVMMFYSLENRQDDKDILIEIIEKQVENVIMKEVEKDV